jgi:hypothetical protein
LGAGGFGMMIIIGLLTFAAFSLSRTTIEKAWRFKHYDKNQLFFEQNDAISFVFFIMGTLGLIILVVLA